MPIKRPLERTLDRKTIASILETMQSIDDIDLVSHSKEVIIETTTGTIYVLGPVITTYNEKGGVPGVVREFVRLPLTDDQKPVKQRGVFFQRNIAANLGSTLVYLADGDSSDLNTMSQFHSSQITGIYINPEDHTVGALDKEEA